MKRVGKRFRGKKVTFAQRLMIVFFVVLFLPFSYIIYIYSSGLTDMAKAEVVKPYEQSVEFAAERYNEFFVEIERDFDFLNKYTLLRENLEMDKKSTAMQSVVADSSLGDVLSIMFADNHQMRVMIYHDNQYLYNPRCFSNIETMEGKEYYDDVMKLTKDDNLFRIGQDDDGYRFYIYRRYNTLENRNVFFEISISYANFIKMLAADSEKSPKLYFTFNDGKTYLLDKNEPKICGVETGRGIYTIRQDIAKKCSITGTFKKNGISSASDGLYVGGSVGHISDGNSAVVRSKNYGYIPDKASQQCG